MKRALPTALTLLLAAVLWLVDPVRRAEPAIDPSGIAGSITLPELQGWKADDARTALPSAFPPHNPISERTWVLDPAPLSDQQSFLRVIVAQDRRDLLAFDPIHAMRAGGWQPVSAGSVDGLWVTRHTRTAPLLDETVTLATAFVVPGKWSGQGSMLRQHDASGPGWPGPGAIVQAIVSEGDRATEIQELVEQLAEDIAGDLTEAGR